MVFDNDAGFRRVALLLLMKLLVAFDLLLLIRNGSLSAYRLLEEERSSSSSSYYYSILDTDDHILLNIGEFQPKLPKMNKIAMSMEQRNRLPPKNIDLFPKLAVNHVKIVLYVHNQPQYLQVVVKSLASVEGIGETMLMVSHDGYFTEMNKNIQGIRFCQVERQGLNWSKLIRFLIFKWTCQCINSCIKRDIKQISKAVEVGLIPEIKNFA